MTNATVLALAPAVMAAVHNNDAIHLEVLLSFFKKREENKTSSKYILYICNLNNQQLTYNQQDDYEC